MAKGRNEASRTNAVFSCVCQSLAGPDFGVFMHSKHSFDQTLTRLCVTWVGYNSVHAEEALLMIFSVADFHYLIISSVLSLLCMCFYCLRRACV